MWVRVPKDHKTETYVYTLSLYHVLGRGTDEK